MWKTLRIFCLGPGGGCRQPEVLHKQPAETGGTGERGERFYSPSLAFSAVAAASTSEKSTAAP
mgnify:CR=1 FL=1